MLLEQGPHDEATIVTAFDLNGGQAQQLLEAFRCADVTCQLVLISKDTSEDAWHGRAHAAAIGAARVWGSRVAGRAARL
eukprot:5120001-Lingulodinium_polyedra.AAC.1